MLSADLSWRDLTPLAAHSQVVPTSSVTTYLSRYGLDSIGSLPIIGTFRSDSFTCVGQIYQPGGQSHGTVFMIHGLFDHVGTMVNGIQTCLRENYTVAAFDLPGHGLSSGERGGIGDFSEYACAFEVFIASCGGLVDTPFVFIGHSTGCAVGLEYVTRQERQPFSAMIFLAPLVRSSYYHLSLAGHQLLRHFCKTVPRWFRNASHDQEFLRRFREDPLQPTIFPLRWATAYCRWFDRIRVLPKRELLLTVIQGTGDDVVDWRYNLPWFERTIVGTRMAKIDGARHQLLNEALPYRQQVLVVLREVLRRDGRK